ncbi:MAG TPA: response regulator transcription factor [bacterium]|nr:response regulator transcription factor [bacterium]
MASIESGKKKILVVDDDKDIHLFLGDFLTNEGYEVRSAYGWKEAVSMLAQYTPDLIILDIMMPEVNGYIISETLKKEMEWKVPILIYSALNRPEDIMTGFSKGSNAFLCKPAPLSEIRETIHYLIEERSKEVPPDAKKK